MTRDEWKERLPLIQAFVEGAEIEVHYPNGLWRTTGESVNFLSTLLTYRIKPKPKDIWVNEYKDFSWAYKSTEDAEHNVGHSALRVAVHYREVLGDE